MKGKVIVTGAKGQLGVDMVISLERQGYQVFGFSRQEMDVTDLNQVKEVVQSIAPDVIIHGAAFTKVDQAEASPDEAYLVNSYGTRNIAIAAEACKAKLVYISTDYVFNGAGTTPYNEFMPTDPIGVYGRSKLAGEHFVRGFHSKWFIIRTSWVFGLHGHNFVKTMLELAKTKGKLTVVADQVGCPTYTVDLAECITQLIETDKYGVYHVSNSGHCSWYEFANAIFREASVSIEVQPVTTDQFPRPARRPAYSVLDHMGLRLNGFHDLRHWREALSDYIIELQKK